MVLQQQSRISYGIFDRLDKVELSEMVQWINEFYSHGEYANRPFMKH